MSLITGTQTIGQGHETTFPQILADRLGVPNERIRLVQGDTDLIPIGGGHGSSRATYMGGTAIWRASDEIIAKGTRIAAEALEAAEADIRFADGDFVVAGTDRGIGAARGRARSGATAGTPLDTYHAWTREWMTFPNGDPCRRGRDRPRHRRGRRWRAIRAVDDYGVLVNPMIAARPGAWRDRPGRRPGAAGARRLRPGIGPGGRRLVHGLRAAARRRPAVLRLSASTRPAARPTRSASRAAARPARSPPSRRSPTRSSTPGAARRQPTSPAPPGGADLAGVSRTQRSASSPIRWLTTPAIAMAAPKSNLLMATKAPTPRVGAKAV